ncbi:MAG: hypothetical protein RBU29_04305 [bacterium]|nr:hypothetical protein [bacterium]
MMSLSSIYLNKVTEETFEEVIFNVSVAVSGTARTVKRGRTEDAPPGPTRCHAVKEDGGLLR